MRTEFGKTIGGFTHYPWLPGNSGWFSNAGRRSFVFSLDMMEKFVPISDGLIGNWDDNGPVFGGNGYGDICIKDGVNNNRNSFCYFPYGYNRAGLNRLERNHESRRLFSGATKDIFFKVL